MWHKMQNICGNVSLKRCIIYETLQAFTFQLNLSISTVLYYFFIFYSIKISFYEFIVILFIVIKIV